MEPGTTISGIPPTVDATTGMPANIASTMTSGKPSFTDGMASTSNAHDAVHGASTHPANSIAVSQRMRTNQLLEFGGRSGPSPTRTSRKPGSDRMASISTSSPFCGARRPTAPMRNVPGGTRGGRRWQGRGDRHTVVDDTGRPRLHVERRFGEARRVVRDTDVRP